MKFLHNIFFLFLIIHFVSACSQSSDKNIVQDNIKNPELYYFYAIGCGFCKRVDPIVDELIKEGHNILRLDVAETDNQGL